MTPDPSYPILQRIAQYPESEEPAVLLDRLEAVVELRDWLGAVERKTVILARFRGVSWYQIGRVYGIAASTAYRRFHG